MEHSVAHLCRQADQGDDADAQGKRMLHGPLPMFVAELQRGHYRVYGRQEQNGFPLARFIGRDSPSAPAADPAGERLRLESGPPAVAPARCWPGPAGKSRPPCEPAQ